MSMTRLQRYDLLLLLSHHRISKLLPSNHWLAESEWAPHRQCTMQIIFLQEYIALCLFFPQAHPSMFYITPSDNYKYYFNFIPWLTLYITPTWLVLQTLVIHDWVHACLPLNIIICQAFHGVVAAVDPVVTHQISLLWACYSCVASILL